MRKRPGADAESAYRADLLEIQHHVRERWCVVQNMIEQVVPPDGTPFPHHFRKLKFPTDFFSFEAKAVNLLDPVTQTGIRKMKAMVRNLNDTIDESYELEKLRSASDVRKMCEHLPSNYR